MSMTDEQSKRALRFFGRRKGKAIKPSREKLMDALLPRVQVSKPAYGLIDFQTLFASNPRKCGWKSVWRR